MSRPTCGVCEGTGKTESISFRNSRKMVERTCSHCHGKGIVAFKVDLYDVLEYLRGVGTGAFSASADAIEKKFGAPKPKRRSAKATSPKDDAR